VLKWIRFLYLMYYPSFWSYNLYWGVVQYLKGWYCIRAAVVLYCRCKGLPVKAAQVVQWKLTDDGIPIDAQCFVYFDQVSRRYVYNIYIWYVKVFG